jgi:hypothetical protein
MEESVETSELSIPTELFEALGKESVFDGANEGWCAELVWMEGFAFGKGTGREKFGI